MPLPPPRSPDRRQADTLATLRATHADVWVATASLSAAGEARPYLVPLSFAWIDERVVLALALDSRTARNAMSARTARLGFGPTRDVVMVDADLVGVHPVAAAPAGVADAYAAQADWDPRSSPDGMGYLAFAPRRIQAWREVNELEGRTVMSAGRWLA